MMEQQTPQQSKPRRLPYGMQNWSVAVERAYLPTRLHRLALLWRSMELAVAEELF